MATSLSPGIFKRLRSFPAVLPDSYNFSSLANSAAAQQVFNYANMDPTGLLARVRSLQFRAPAAAGLSYILSADAYQTPAIDALAASLLDVRGDGYHDVWNAAATQTLQLQVVNQTGAAIANQWQSWAVEVEHPSIAQKLQFAQNFGPLTAAEHALANRLGLLPPNPRGVLPRSLRWIVENEYRGQIVDAVPFAATKQVTGGAGAVSMFIANRRGDTALVLTSLAASPGSGSDGLTYVVSVDQENDFLSVPAYGIGSGKPMPLFLQAEQQIQISALADTTVSASLAGVVWIVRLTDEIRFRLHLGLQHEIGVDPTLDKIIAGVI